MFLSFSHFSTSSIDIHSKNPNFSRTLQMILRVAQYPSTVLIEGETGTGKEKIATLIHEASPRSMMPFVKINCGAIPDALAESELFGYKGGAFMGAKKEGQFREDLYYRLQVAHFIIPALRERPEDLPYLIDLFLYRFSEIYKMPIKIFSEEVMERFLHYHWPGNIRQLQNCIEGIYATIEHETVCLEELPAFLQNSSNIHIKPTGLREQVAAFEKQIIERVLQETKSLRQAATILHIPHATLLRRIEKWGIQKNKDT
ncbi:sigma 54-interacting transcriptional regulator [Aneurinibacillus aneurinilyticus]|uniref:sigma 54-interacting transcriptional regulator n=1 Tax=Aneurinibacillus aneurinilyticus TaxID=1391 RepID=UPI0023F1F0A9|nr:sigma 54-interacting transcriptional regulator [Aneurinibacillus aneurinilyticus]